MTTPHLAKNSLGSFDFLASFSALKKISSSLDCNFALFLILMASPSFSSSAIAVSSNWGSGISPSNNLLHCFSINVPDPPPHLVPVLHSWIIFLPFMFFRLKKYGSFAPIWKIYSASGLTSPTPLGIVTLSKSYVKLFITPGKDFAPLPVNAVFFILSLLNRFITSRQACLIASSGLAKCIIGFGEYITSLSSVRTA